MGNGQLTEVVGVLAGTNAAFDALGHGTCDWKAKCVAFGAVGAKVNMGVNRGVSALLKQAAGQHVIPIHCMPHRLEWAILNLQRNETMVAKFYDLLHLVWKTYHQSPKSRRELNLIGEELAKEGSLSTDSGQYSAVLRHMDHLASSAASAEIQGRAKKLRSAEERPQSSSSHLSAEKDSDGVAGYAGNGKEGACYVSSWNVYKGRKRSHFRFVRDTG
ncbi:unnamed protein product [Boreogadus saida]